MAIKTKKGTVGSYKGKVGDVVLTTWLDIEVMKSASGPRKKKTTSIPVMAQNALFSLVGKFLSRVKGNVFNSGFQFRNKKKMTSINAATSYHLLNAVSGEYPNYRMDMSKVKFTRAFRSTDTAWNTGLFRLDDGSIEVRWELNPFPLKSTELDDEAHIIMFDEDQNRFNVFTQQKRADLVRRFNYYSYFQGHKRYYWLFFISADRKLVSETEYLGMQIMSI